MAVGIICEYNPFHNGHLYHLNKVKEMFKEEEIILILGGNVLQRGNISIINKFDKAKIALEYGANLVIELPFVYATQGADIFAEGAIKLLNLLKCKKVVFGSESGDINMLVKNANIALFNEEYDSIVKRQLDKGINYPTATSEALKELGGALISSPNDILGLSYIKEIIKNKFDMEAVTIKRTNDYHGIDIDGTICSSTAIREAMKNNKDIKDTLPLVSYELINKTNIDDNYFLLLKYKILSEKEKIKLYQTVDEGIENRILKCIVDSHSINELITKIKTKRYTYNKIHRMLTHILFSLTKEESEERSISYIRILGFDDVGSKYLNTIKKEVNTPIITNVTKENYPLLEKDLYRDKIYDLLTNSCSCEFIVKK